MAVNFFLTSNLNPSRLCGYPNPSPGRATARASATTKSTERETDNLGVFVRETFDKIARYDYPAVLRDLIRDIPFLSSLPLIVSSSPCLLLLHQAPMTRPALIYLQPPLPVSHTMSTCTAPSLGSCCDIPWRGPQPRRDVIFAHNIRFELVSH